RRVTEPRRRQRIAGLGAGGVLPGALVRPALEPGVHPAAESGLDRQLHAVLLGKRTCERLSRDVPELDQRVTEAAAALGLGRKRLLKPVLGQETLVDEQPPKRAPGDLGSFHGVSIGSGSR